MSASRCLPTVLLLATALVHADEADESPDTEFLEYLGMWEGSDEEWTLFEGEPLASDGVADVGGDGSKDDERRIDPAPPGEASMETDDEG
jgi:hypothetical protein